MKRTAAALTLALVALGGCSKNDPSALDPSPGTAAPTTTAPATGSPATTPPGSGCPAPPVPAGVTVISATVAAGKVTTAHAQWSVKLGSKVRVAVRADTADEVHVHSYDKKADTTPGCPTAIDFTTNIPGTVEVELEKAKLHLFDIKAS
jgi:hypothetical protein